jgi:succinoglycan biosynthesis protein ExoM
VGGRKPLGSSNLEGELASEEYFQPDFPFNNFGRRAVTGTATPHISVCICTFKRAELLTLLLEKLSEQKTGGGFTFSAVVADNDPAQSARATVAAFSSATSMPVTYCFEERQNIALTRNKSLENANGDFIAFIDDDEYPAADWLLNMYNTRKEYDVAGVLGPVVPYFEHKPPSWATKGKFFDRVRFKTGFQLSSDQSRTGNVLFKRDILSAVDVPFRSQFDTAGEDIDFFRRMMEKGFKFIWCDEGIAYELVPASRCTRKYLLRRALLRGSNFSKHPADRFKNGAKSLIAVPCYAISLPVLILFGQPVFLRYLIKLFDHFSRLLAYVGLPVVTQRQT